MVLPICLFLCLYFGGSFSSLRLPIFEGGLSEAPGAVFGDEGGGALVLLAVGDSRIGEDEVLFGSGDGDVEESTFLFLADFIVERSRMGDLRGATADDPDPFPLQPFCGVDGGDYDRIVRMEVVAGATEDKAIEEFGEWGVGMGFHRLDEIVDRIVSFFAIFRIVGKDERTNFIVEILALFPDFFYFLDFRDPFDQFLRAGGPLFGVKFFAGMAFDRFGGRSLSDAREKHESSEESDFIEGIVSDPKKADKVFDLGGVGERLAPIFFEKDFFRHQRDFHRIEMARGAGEDREMGVVFAGLDLFLNPFRDRNRLLLGIGEGGVFDSSGGFLTAGEDQRAFGFGDDDIGEIEDALTAAVVVFQFEDFRLFVFGTEFRDNANIGAAESVDRLIGVADRHEKGGIESIENRLIESVVVLHLIDENIFPAFTELSGISGIVGHSFDPEDEEIVVVDDIGGPFELFVKLNRPEHFFGLAFKDRLEDLRRIFAGISREGVESV